MAFRNPAPAGVNVPQSPQQLGVSQTRIYTNPFLVCTGTSITIALWNVRIFPFWVNRTGFIASMSAYVTSGAIGSRYLFCVYRDDGGGIPAFTPDPFQTEDISGIASGYITALDDDTGSPMHFGVTAGEMLWIGIQRVAGPGVGASLLHLGLSGLNPIGPTFINAFLSAPTEFAGYEASAPATIGTLPSSFDPDARIQRPPLVAVQFGT